MTEGLVWGSGRNDFLTHFESCGHGRRKALSAEEAHVSRCRSISLIGTRD